MTGTDTGSGTADKVDYGHDPFYRRIFRSVDENNDGDDRVGAPASASGRLRNRL